MSIERIEIKLKALSCAFFSLMPAITAIVVGVMALNFCNLRDERRSVEELREKVLDIAGKRGKPAELLLLTKDGFDNQLAGNKVVMKYHESNSGGTGSQVERKVSFTVGLSNKGERGTGPLYVKVYSADTGIELTTNSTDEHKYLTESAIFVDNYSMKNLPGGMCTTYTFAVPVNRRPSVGAYKMLLKIIWGEGKVTLATFLGVLNGS